MKNTKLNSARPRARSAVSTQHFQDATRQRALVTKSRFEFQQACFRALSRRDPQPAEQGPLPRAVKTALRKYHADLKQVGTGRPSVGRAATAVAHFDLEEYLSSMIEHAVATLSSSFEIAEVGFWVAPPEGQAGAGQVDAQKAAWCSVGSADVEGAGACSWNWEAFGFSSSFNLAGTGGIQHVTISSSYTIDYAWLEALSFGSQSWGEVVGASYLDVALDSSTWSDALDLVHGISPRGHYADGEIGVWHPDPYGEDRNHTIEFTVNLSRDAEHFVSIYETICFYAMRHGRVDRCDAVAEVSCAFNPVRVRISSPW